MINKKIDANFFSIVFKILPSFPYLCDTHFVISFTICLCYTKVTSFWHTFFGDLQLTKLFCLVYFYVGFWAGSRFKILQRSKDRQFFELCERRCTNSLPNFSTRSIWVKQWKRFRWGVKIKAAKWFIDFRVNKIRTENMTVCLKFRLYKSEEFFK